MINHDFYSIVTSRNYLYIDELLQNRIRHASLVFYGVGLSSNIVIQAVRLGFENITIVDGDIIELSNLNRQQFNENDKGKFKVDCLKETCLKINPHCHIQAHAKFMTDINDHDEIIKQADVIINTIDCGKHYFDLIETGRENCLVICPFNPGFSGFAICFDKMSYSSYEYFETDKPLTERAVSDHILSLHSEIRLLKDIKMSVSEFLDHVDITGYYPQISIGASFVAGLVNHIIISYFRGDNIICAPRAYCITNSMEGGI